jgi:hypothetical protein
MTKNGSEKKIWRRNIDTHLVPQREGTSEYSIGYIGQACFVNSSKDYGYQLDSKITVTPMKRIIYKYDLRQLAHLTDIQYLV